MHAMKSQSAMEYLMTYGWSILIIAVVLGALFQLGIFNSANFAPRAQPGNCHVFKSSQGATLEGVCGGELPQFVAQFNAPSSYVTVPYSTSFQSGNTFTVSVWAYSSNWPNQISNSWFINDWGGGSSSGYLFGGCCQGSYTITMRTFESGVEHDSSGYNPTGGSWLNIIGVISSSSVSLYVQGVQIGSPVSLPTPLAITGGAATIGSNFQGTIANLQIYNASLTVPEVNALYLEGIGGAPVLPTNIVGWWPLNGDTNDYSGNNNNGVPSSVTYTSQWLSGYTIP